MAIHAIKRIEDDVVVYVNGGTIVDSATENHLTFQEATADWGLDVDGWDKSKFTSVELADDYAFPEGFACDETWTLVGTTMSKVA